MGKSLQDQLLKAGLANKKQAVKARKAKADAEARLAVAMRQRDLMRITLKGGMQKRKGFAANEASFRKDLTKARKAKDEVEQTDDRFA